MRRKMMGAAALTCIIGGSALLAPTPAASQSEYPVCEDVVRMPCGGYGGVMECTRRSGGQDWLTCDGQFWVWA